MKSTLIILTIILLSCASTDQSGAEDQKAELTKIDREFSRMSVEKGTVEAFLHFMAEDVTIFPKFGHPIRGKETYQTMSSAADDSGETSRLTWEPTFADISGAEDLGYTLGRYTRTITDSSGDVQIKHGYYVTIWKKQPDGSWKFVFDTGNESPPHEETSK